MHRNSGKVEQRGESKDFGCGTYEVRFQYAETILVRVSGPAGTDRQAYAPEEAGQKL